MTFSAVGGVLLQNIKSNRSFGLFQCQKCLDGIIVEVSTSTQGGAVLNNWFAGTMHGIDVKIGEIIPGPKTVSAPEHTPANVASFYEQGHRAFHRDDYDASGTMFRKALDTALKRLHPEGKGTLQKRIDSLPEEVGVTKAMREWAHVIREEGNDASHEEEPYTRHQAVTLQAFTEMFLIYTFSLPGRMTERRNSTSA